MEEKKEKKDCENVNKRKANEDMRKIRIRIYRGVTMKHEAKMNLW